jgi:serine/threonine-protein kinase RsbW
MPPASDPFAQSDTHDLVIRAEPVSVRAALRAITSAPPVCDLVPDQRATVELVLAEVLNNVAEHAYADRPGHVAVTVSLRPLGLACEVLDEGAAMPNNAPPAGQLPEGDLPEGGFGWHLIRSLTQDLSYRRKRGTNRLSFCIPLTDQG